MYAILAVLIQVQSEASGAPLDAKLILANVEASRESIHSGVLELRYLDEMDGSRRYSANMTGFFDGHGRYGISMRNHTFFNDGINDNRVPQCIQLFDGESILGMWRSVQVQEYFVVDERSARLQCFNSLWLGIAFFPVPGSNPNDLYFWRSDAIIESVESGAMQPQFHQVRIKKLQPEDARSETTLTIDSSRGWNIVRIDATYASGYRVAVDSELSQFGDIWFPSRVTMRQNSDDGGSAIATVDILKADFNVECPDSTFEWSRLGKPDDNVAAVVKDLRANAARHILGYFDGERITQDRPSPARPLPSPQRPSVNSQPPESSPATASLVGQSAVAVGILLTLCYLFAVNLRPRG